MTAPLPPSADLDKERLGLLYLVDAPAPNTRSPAAERLAQADRDTLRRLLGSPLQRWCSGVCPLAAAPLLDLLSSTEAGKQQLIVSDIELITRVLQQRADVQRTGAFGLTDAAFPVVLEDRVISCVWLRGYLTRPLTDQELAEIAGASGRSGPAAVRDIAEACPLVDPVQAGRLQDLARSTRDALTQAVLEHLEARSLANQFLRTERTRALGTLSSGVAHRFNNLLSIILGYSSFVLNRERLSGDAEEALKKISNAAQQGRRITEEILSFAGSDVEQEMPCRVHSMLGSILSLLQSQYSSRIRVRTELDAESDLVTAPPSSIHQLVFNLLSNAFDSMPEGGELDVRSSVVRGELDGKTVPYLSLVVSDSGGGSPDLSEESADPTGRRTSLMLSQANGIAGALQGSVTVTSRSGATTQVDVRLPLAVQTAPVPDHPPKPRGLAPAVIWVVDDDPIFREMCREVLGEAGHAVETLAAGRELLARWHKADAAPDLILIDFSMPEYNGLELCTWLKEQGCESPIVLVSGFTRTQPDIHRALEFRKTHFLRKPFSFREMMDTVTVALGESLIQHPVAPKPRGGDD